MRTGSTQIIWRQNRSAHANLPKTLLTRLEEYLGGWEPPPTYAAVFGSAVRGTMTVDSDIDLLVVFDDTSAPDVSARHVHALATAVTRWTGNDARIVEYSASALVASRAEPVLRDVLEHGLTVIGSRSWLMKQLHQASIRLG